LLGRADQTTLSLKRRGRNPGHKCDPFSATALPRREAADYVENPDTDHNPTFRYRTQLRFWADFLARVAVR
jgi:hypothetical protein